MKVILNENNFSGTLDSSKVVLLNFWSDFCGPCKVQSRVLDQIDEKYGDKLVLAEINSHNQNDWVQAFGVQSTPTTFLFYQGEVLAKLTGVHSLSKIEQLLNEAGVLN